VLDKINFSQLIIEYITYFLPESHTSSMIRHYNVIKGYHKIKHYYLYLAITIIRLLG